MQILLAIKDYAYDILAVLAMFSIVIEISPIKINPWSWLLKAIGSRMNSDIMTRLKEVEDQLAQQDAKIDNNEKDRIRFEILDFARTCRQHDEHTTEEFDHIFEQYDKYEVILAKLEQPNGKVTQAMHFINGVYQTVCEKNNFVP